MNQTLSGCQALSLRFLVVGSNGFIGSNLATFFEMNGHKVHTISRVDGDLEMQSTWEKFDTSISYDGIFFCVEITGNQTFFEQNFPYDISSRNLRMLMNFDRFLAALKFSSKVFFFNSLWSAARLCTLISEEDLFTYEKSSNVTGLMMTKIHIFELVKKINAGNSPHDAIVITTGTIFGPGDNSDHLIPSILRQLRSNPSVLRLSGGPSSVRNYFYVQDLCRCLLSLVSYSKIQHKSIIVSSDTKLSIGEVVGMLTKKFGVPQVEWGSKADNFSERIPNTSLFTRKYMPEGIKFKSLENFDVKELKTWV
jgi:nucleoside-diphosphate-sugar epimerase